MQPKPLSFVLVAALVAVAFPLSASAETGAVAAVVVEPATATVNLLQTVAFTARAFDADGVEVAAAAVRWDSSQDGPVDTISDDGVFRPRAAGTATVTATVDGVVGAAAVVVSDRLETTVDVDAGAALAPVSGTVTVAYQDGTPPNPAGVVVYFVQKGPTGATLRSTYVTAATDADGVASFAPPPGWNLPGDYVVRARVYDGANSGDASSAYTVGL